MANVTEEFFMVTAWGTSDSGVTTNATEIIPPPLGAGEIAAVVFLFMLSTVGTIGNILIIYSVITQQELRRLTGNIFICNLAVADLIVTAILFPLTALNLLNGNKSVVPMPACYFIGFLLPVSCNASILNLMFISVQRLMVTTASATSKQNILKRPSAAFLIAMFVWVWTIMMVSPVLVKLPSTGNILLLYDKGATMCSWDDISEPRFQLSMIILAYFIPLIISMLCYWTLFQRVKRRALDISRRSKNAASQLQKRETRLLKTILIVLVCFVVSWTPYCCSIVLTSFGVDIDVRHTSIKRPIGWLGMFNSTVNSFIYGWRNENFRRGYITCMLQIGDFITCNRYHFQRRYNHRRQKHQYCPKKVVEVK